MSKVLHTYLCFHKTRKVEVLAESSYQAQLEAATQLKVKKAFEITVFLHKKADGSEVTHDGSEI